MWLPNGVPCNKSGEKSNAHPFIKCIDWKLAVRMQDGRDGIVIYHADQGMLVGMSYKSVSWQEPYWQVVGQNFQQRTNGSNGRYTACHSPCRAEQRDRDAAVGVGTSTLKETAAECVKHAIGLGYRLVDVGKIRAIGVSNFNPHHVDELLAYARIKPVVNQIKIHPYMEHQEVVGNTFAKGIQVQWWSRWDRVRSMKSTMTSIAVYRRPLSQDGTPSGIALSDPVGYGCYPKNDTHRTYEGKSRNVR